MAESPHSIAWLRPFALLTGAAIVLVLLWWAHAVLIPLALAILITFLLSPLVSQLQRRGLKRVPAVIVVIAVSGMLVGGVGWLVARQFRGLVDAYPGYEHNIRQKIASFKSAGEGGFLDRLQKIVERMGRELSEKTEDPEDLTTAPAVRAEKAYPVTIVDESPFKFSQLWTVLAPLLEPIASVGLAVVLVIFMLIKREDLRDRVISLVGHARVTITTKALDEAGQRISRYLLMQAIINGSFGLAVCIGLLVIGVPYAMLWGLLAGVLRYIPYLGPWVAAVLPILMSFLVSDSWLPPMLVIALFLVLEFFSNMVMEPLLYGRGVGVSEAATLVMVAFWTWLWGPIGLVLATPLTVCLAVLGRYVPFLKFLDTLLSDQPALDPHIGYYQRLIAKDQDEATDIAEEHLAATSWDETADALLIPALTYTRRDAANGKLSEGDQEFALNATREIVEELAEFKSRIEEATASPDGRAEEDSPTLPRTSILCCAARGKIDEVALLMLKEGLDAKRFEVSIASPSLLASEVVRLVEETKPGLVCIAALPPGGLAHTRLLCLRLRARFPQLKILVGRWGLKGSLDKNREQILAAGADRMATSVVETRKQIMAFAPVVAQTTESRAAAAKKTEEIAATVPP
jgi:predicted PurR-regulated permease PerM